MCFTDILKIPGSLRFAHAESTVARPDARTALHTPAWPRGWGPGRLRATCPHALPVKTPEGGRPAGLGARATVQSNCVTQSSLNDVLTLVFKSSHRNTPRGKPGDSGGVCGHPLYCPAF